MSIENNSTNHKDVLRAALLSAGEIGTWLTLHEIELLLGYKWNETMERLADLRKDGFTVERRIRSHSEWVHEYILLEAKGKR